ncbi:MAG: alginate lyase family protein [Acidobacteriota bacterium]
MSIVRKIKRAVRGEVNAKTAALEVLRRSGAAMARRRERARLRKYKEQAARLRTPFAGMRPDELLVHFRNRSQPFFLPGFSSQRVSGNSQRLMFPRETDRLISTAEQIISEHAWPIMGLGNQSFGHPIDWHRDPLSGAKWPLDYHADIQPIRGDGSDVRVLWELNRLPHFITLARAYAVTGDERLTTEFLQQLSSWRSQNPYGYGANWNCAMEVALRAINLLGAFEVFRHSALLDQQTLSTLLASFDEHGMFIRQNLEFSYIGTSNHYLSDVVGLVWLGIMLPELAAAETWRGFGLREMLREMDKQVLADGADFEASTGYHRFVLELFLYTFILAQANAIEIEERYWDKLRGMLNYVRAYLRADGRAPLIGDSDSGQVFPVRAREANDQAYVLALGAVLFKNASLIPAGLAIPEEVLWIFGEPGVGEYQELRSIETSASSAGFPEGGIYVLRAGDLYLSFNASDAGIGGRGSHGHNDALSLEVSACGVAFIVDPGTCVYTADLKERHLFRSTVYHSTVEIDGMEQNTTDEELPFVIGNEARPRVLVWETGAEFDRVSAEHYGYRRLPHAVRHRRTVTFKKRERWWLVEDEFLGEGNHDFRLTVHFDMGLDVNIVKDYVVRASETISGARLLVMAEPVHKPELIANFISRNYASKSPSVSACWAFKGSVPCKVRWVILPVCPNEHEEERIQEVQSSVR